MYVFIIFNKYLTKIIQFSSTGYTDVKTKKVIS